MAPGTRSEFDAAMFEPEVFRKQIFCIEESICDIIKLFRRPGKCPPLAPPRSAPACVTKHKIDNKTRQKHQYNTIPIITSIFFPREYTVAHLRFIKYIENCQGHSKIAAIFFVPCMLTDCRQKRFVMNMQLNYVLSEPRFSY